MPHEASLPDALIARYRGSAFDAAIDRPAVLVPVAVALALDPMREFAYRWHFRRGTGLILKSPIRSCLVLVLPIKSTVQLCPGL